MRVGGVVLCGGRSSRMGTPKAWLPVAGEPMLVRVVRVVSDSVGGPLVVVAALGQDVPPLPPGVELVRDPEEGQGPLAGLVAGLEALTGRADAAYLSACDVPFLSTAFVRRVCERLAGFDIAAPDAGGFRHPLAAAYRLTVLPVARDLVTAGRLRPAFLFDAVPTRVLTPADFADIDPELRSLVNVNTPDEYAAAVHSTSQIATNPFE
jgi:molybdopterin-guanine dinucleotide biosynthesis protein A